jgi:purine-binding chemotaxis protein CheW
MQQEYVVFRLVGEKYVHLVDIITEVMIYSEPVPVPGAPEVVEGILNVRGSVVTVISGRKLIKHEVITATGEWRIILLETPDGLYGISVDAVDEIIRFPVEDIANTGGMADSVFIKGTVQHALGLVILLDFTEIGKNPPPTCA